MSSSSTQSTGTSSRLTHSARSGGNLAILAERRSAGSATSSDTIAKSRITELSDDDIDEDEYDDDNDPEAASYESALRELEDIRRRRMELNARCAAKVEYIKAKLRAAEIHEKVMRR